MDAGKQRQKPKCRKRGRATCSKQDRGEAKSRHVVTEGNSIGATLDAMIGFLRSGKLLSDPALCQKLLTEFINAEQRSHKYSVQTISAPNVSTAGQLQDWLEEQDWSDGVVVLRNTCHADTPHNKLSAYLSSTAVSDIGGVLGMQQHAPTISCWDDVDPAGITPTAFKQHAEAVSAALDQLWQAAAVQHLHCQPNDANAYCCFVEAVMAAAPAGMLSALYAPEINPTHISHGGRSDATLLDEQLPAVDWAAEAGLNIEVSQSDRYATCTLPWRWVLCRWLTVDCDAVAMTEASCVIMVHIMLEDDGWPVWMTARCPLQHARALRFAGVTIHTR